MSIDVRHSLKILFIAVAIVSGNTPVLALDGHIQFSAEAVQTVPQRPTHTMRMFIGEHAVRTEYLMGEQWVAEIIMPEEKRRVLLIPHQGTYMEQVGDMVPQMQFSPRHEASPCEGMEDVTCRAVGEDVISGRKAVKWVFTSNVKQKPTESLHWIDKERNLALREEFADGTVTELKLLANEKLESRDTEKWELLVTGKDGNKALSQQWYDPELQVTIREELPGGYVRELRNIKIGPQAATLFEVPADYQKVATPAQTYQGLQTKPRE